MLNIIIALILSAPALISSTSLTCQESRQLDNNCGSYCFKVVKPVLEYTAKLQKQVDGQEDSQKADTQSKLENIENQMVILQEKVALIERKSKGSEEKFKNRQSIFENIGSKYYYIEEHKTMNWFLAAYRCQELGGHLASLQDKTEANALAARLSSNSLYWTDINDLGKEGQFYSHTTGRLAPYLNWDSEEPNDDGGAEDCVLLVDKHKMNDENCKTRLHFICESYNI